MSNSEMKQFTVKLQEGLLLAEKRMLQEKALHGQTVVVMGDDNTIQHIPAGIKNGKHKRFAPHAMGLHKFIGITETGLQRFQAGSALAGTHPFVPFLG